jgi:membrane-associated phospholipid phosphatase
MSSYRFVDWITQGFLVVVATLVLIWHQRAPAWWPLLVGGHLAAMVAIHFLVCRAGRAQSSRPVYLLRQLYPVLLYTVFFRETELINGLIGSDRLDPKFIELEHRLFGSQPSALWMMSAPSVWASELMYLSYFSYYLMIAGLGAWLLWKNPAAFQRFISVVSFVFYVCYFVYFWVPVVGPRLFFRDTPERTLYASLYHGASPPVAPETVQSGPLFQLMKWIYHNFEANSAAFPSSHVAVALTTLWFSWHYVRPVRWIHAVFVALLCISTVYCRYHYAVDVPAGIVTALVLAPIGNWLSQKFDGSADSQSARS